MCFAIYKTFCNILKWVLLHSMHDGAEYIRRYTRKGEFIITDWGTYHQKNPYNASGSLQVRVVTVEHHAREQRAWGWWARQPVTVVGVRVPRMNRAHRRVSVHLVWDARAAAGDLKVLDVLRPAARRLQVPDLLQQDFHLVCPVQVGHRVDVATRFRTRLHVQPLGGLHHCLASLCATQTHTFRNRPQTLWAVFGDPTYQGKVSVWTADHFDVPSPIRRFFRLWFWKTFPYILIAVHPALLLFEYWWTNI